MADRCDETGDVAEGDAARGAADDEVGGPAGQAARVLVAHRDEREDVRLGRATVTVTVAIGAACAGRQGLVYLGIAVIGDAGEDAVQAFGATEAVVGVGAARRFNGV